MMNYLARFGDKHERKDKKMPDRSQSVEPKSTPLSPDSNPRRPLDTPSAAPKTNPGTETNLNWALVEEVDNEAGSHLHGKRRTLSISRSGRCKPKDKGRSRILSDEVYRGLSVASPTSPSPPQPPPPQLQKDLVKPNGRDKSPARPYIILKSDASVNFPIESTSL